MRWWLGYKALQKVQQFCLRLRVAYCVGAGGWFKHYGKTRKPERRRNHETKEVSFLQLKARSYASVGSV